MKVTESLDAALWTLLAKPSAILPFYFIGTGASTAATSVVLLGLFVVFLVLLGQGRIAAAQEALEGVDFSAFAEDAETLEVDELTAEQLREAAEALAAPEAAVILLLSIVGAGVAFVVFTAIVQAGQYGTVYSALRGGEPITDGIGGVRRHGRSFIGLRVIEIGLYVVFTAIFGGVLAWGAIAGVDPLTLVAIGLLAGIIWLVAVLVVAAIFVFAPASVVVDGVGTFASIRRSVGFIVRRPAAFVVYVVIVIGIVMAMGTLAGIVSVLGIPNLVTLLGFLVVTPYVHLLKTAIYADEELAEAGRERASPSGAPATDGGTESDTDQESIEPQGGIDGQQIGDRQQTGYRKGDGTDPENADSELTDAAPEPASAVRTRIRRGWNRSWNELWRFVRETPGLIAFSMVLFVVGTVVGYETVQGFGFTPPSPPDEPGLIFGRFPLDAFVYIAINNWMVAIGQSFAGFVLGVPTALTLLFNGVIVGAISAIGYDPIVIIALVAPHGIIELPAIFVSGALGFYLAIVGLRRIRGRIGDETVATEIERAYWVLLGLGLVLIVAAFVEAFITPYVGMLVI